METVKKKLIFIGRSILTKIANSLDHLFFFFAGLALTSFFFAYEPSKKHFISRWFPQPSISCMRTEPSPKVKSTMQGSPFARYLAVVDDVNLASPFNSPLHSPLSFSK